MSEKILTVDDLNANGSKFMFDCSVAVTYHCGGTVEIGKAVGDNLPRNEDGSPVHIGLHSAPHCKEFERLDLLSYMRWLRGATDV